VHPDTQQQVELGCSYEDLGGVTYRALRNRARPEPPSHYTVEKDKVYLLSDNRDMHVDSRDFGTVDPGTCKKIVGRLWSKDGPGDSAHRFNSLL
jgi:signal peptidase I